LPGSTPAFSFLWPAGLITGGIKSRLAAKGVTEEVTQPAKIGGEKLNPIVESPVSKAVKAYTDLINLPKEILPDVNLKALSDSYRVFEAKVTPESTKAFMDNVHESIKIASENSKGIKLDEGTTKTITKLEGIRDEIKGYIDSGEVIGDNEAKDNNLDNLFKTSDEAFTYYKEMAEQLDVSTEKDQATFYSGPGNRKIAEEFAVINGKITLEMTSGGKYLDNMNLFAKGSPLTKAQAPWVRASLLGLSPEELRRQKKV
jgi:hypothetical protein